jgi:hypothetical protein
VAKESFEQAYKLDPNNSFAINNMGYLAELQGDKETAQSFYEQAQRAQRARQKVMVSTRPELEGQSVAQVAEQSSTLVETGFAARAEAKRQSGGAPALKTRDNRTVVEPKSNPNNLTPPEFQRPPGDGTPQGNTAPNNNAPNNNAPNNTAPNNNAPQPDQQNQTPPELKTRPPQQQPSSPPPNSQPQ